MNLDEYLLGAYPSDRQVVERLRSLCSRVLALIGRACDRNGAWPYELTNREPIERVRKFSFSTNAMLLHAIAVTTGEISNSVLAPAVRQLDRLDSGLVGNALERGLTQLADQWPARPTSPLTTSTTWGDDDPLTLAWLLEVGTSDIGRTIAPSVRQHVLDRAAERVTSAMAEPATPVLHGNSLNAKPVPHVFPLLRVIQLRQALGGFPDADVTEAETFLREQLHLQLSYSTIRDSGFDPAQLTFALEALLIVARNSVQTAIVQRVIEVLHETRSRVPYWRPVRPLTVSSQGMILLPQSLEVANSLLRICDLLDREDPSAQWFAGNLDLLQEYSSWLESRCIRGATGGQRPISFEGWQSEHTHAPDLVHIWATSQALLFFHHFGSMLQRHVARTLRTSAGLTFQACSRAPGSERAQAREAINDQDPLCGASTTDRHRVSARLEERFLKPRDPDAAQAGAHYSILLFGPPGTGKTSLAQRIATALGFDFLIVTPSDFVQTGEASVEARARDLFTVVREQSDMVVLFDEIDRLILDRDLPAYNQQSDMFQFMTPGMLTKLADLRKEQRVVFIIGTNYAERIDAAIKRPGRIDDHMALLPPATKQREGILKSQLRKAGHRSGQVTSAVSSGVLRDTALFVFQELRQVVERTTAYVESGVALGAALRQAVAETAPGIRLPSYRSRFSDEDREPSGEPPGGPLEEFLLLAYLVVEAGGTITEDWMRNVIRRGLTGKIVDAEVASRLKGGIA